jgi:hypothetical protein
MPIFLKIWQIPVSHMMSDKEARVASPSGRSYKIVDVFAIDNDDHPSDGNALLHNVSHSYLAGRGIFTLRRNLGDHFTRNMSKKNDMFLPFTRM